MISPCPPLPRSSAGTADLAEFRKLQDIIDNQADQILDLHEVLKSAYLLNEFIAGAYVLSLADFRYLNIVSTKIKAALPGGDVTPTEPQTPKEPSASELVAWFRSRPGTSWEATIRDIEKAVGALAVTRPQSRTGEA